MRLILKLSAMMSIKNSDKCLGYVLRAKPLLENSRLVDLFTREHGRLRVVARGQAIFNQRRKSSSKAALRQFQQFQINLKINSGLSNLRDYDEQPPFVILVGRALYGGLYLNELLIRLLPSGEPCGAVFEAYTAALDGVAATEEFEPVLRYFERVLLESMGYGIDWDVEAHGDTKIDPCVSYQFIADVGFQKSHATAFGAILGADILAIGQGRLESLALRRAAKHIMRAALAPHLGDRPLYTRELFAREASSAQV